MNNVEKFLEESNDIKEFSKKYFDYLHSVLVGIETTKFEALEDALNEARDNDNTVFVIGNGGSAATASHITNDFGMLSMKGKEEFAPYRLISLTDNFSIISAIGNDFGYEDIFEKQLKLSYKKGDKLIVISASGNSPNLIKAAEYVNAQGGEVIGFLGFDGGKLNDMCKLPIVADTPKGEYGPVEDVHMILDHMVSVWLHWRLHKGNV